MSRDEVVVVAVVGIRAMEAAAAAAAAATAEEVAFLVAQNPAAIIALQTRDEPDPSFEQVRLLTNKKVTEIWTTSHKSLRFGRQATRENKK